MGERKAFTGTQVAAVVVAALLVGSAVGMVVSVPGGPPNAPHNRTNTTSTTSGNVAAFTSADAFRTYLREAGRASETRSHTVRRRRDIRSRGVEVERTPGPTATPVAASTRTGDTTRAAPEPSAPEPRTSTTNVQVAAVDEPDILKTTSDTLYYASRQRRIHEHHTGAPPTGSTHMLDVTDPASPSLAAELDVTGQLLLAGDQLVVLDDNTVLGYDVSDRSSPRQTWSRPLNGRLVTARLYQGHVYLVVGQGIDRSEPCPIEPVDGTSVDCTAIHRPTEPVRVDTTYSVMVVDPADGTVDNTAAFVGAARESAVYMSEGSVYLTYTDRSPRSEMLLDFLIENQSHRLDDATLSHLRAVREYNLSAQAREEEVEATIREWLRDLDNDRRRAVVDDFNDERQAWAEANRRDYVRTGIVEFDLQAVGTAVPQVAVGPVGSVPGMPLNQFSLDEHDGHLRIATTIPGVMGTDSANDVYVLDRSLTRVGAVQDMGLTERIYSVRFVGDEAYVVTFRRIDPFHVIDLSDPQAPRLEGTLKLPGFSSYLHPLDDDRVLGIGEENGRVKLVVFDVSDPRAPSIEHSRVLDARWSAIARSHHAFLQDQKHGVFFLPTSDAGLVYRYEDGLDRVATIEVRGNARRAAYVGDYLYVFGDESVTVVDETTWSRTGTLDL